MGDNLAMKIDDGQELVADTADGRDQCVGGSV
jgi:hypothetical protein